MRVGVRLGVDVGTVRIGVARSDPDGLIAVPLETVARSTTGADIARIAALAETYRAIECVVGHPRALSGAETASTRDAASFAARIARAGVPVRLVDERLSTVSAGRALRDAGRSARAQRGAIDQAAAVVILQHALDWERSTGIASGYPLPTPSPPEPPKVPA